MKLNFKIRFFELKFFFKNKLNKNMEVNRSDNFNAEALKEPLTLKDISFQDDNDEDTNFDEKQEYSTNY